MSVASISARWWARPDLAHVVLGNVAASPGAVEQAVGSSLLGYHALAVDALAPLARRTLVDADGVERALGGLDLEPVAKAFASAQRDVLGDAADDYGHDLAREIHDNATEASVRMTMAWTSSGLPWPFAVERAAEVHGVPLPFLGRYANLMKAPAVAGIVREDAADRVLMGYAEALGRREAAAGSVVKSLDAARAQRGVSKAAATADFEEHEHPRGKNGRFIEVDNQRADVERKARIARTGRTLRSVQAQRAQVARIQQERQAAERQASRPAAEATDVRSVLARSAPQRSAARTQARPALAARRVERAQAQPAAPQSQTQEKQAAQVHMDKQTSYVLVAGDQIEDLLKHGGAFHVGAMRKVLGGQDMAAFSEQQLQSMFTGPVRGVALLRIDGGTPLVDGGLDDALGGQLAHDARFEIDPMMDYFEVDSGERNPWDPPGAGGGPPIPVYNITLKNADQLLERGDQPVGKAARFDEREHPRGESGRFANKPADRDARAERAARTQRGQRQVATYQQAVRRLQAERLAAQGAAAEVGETAAPAAAVRAVLSRRQARTTAARPARSTLARVYARRESAQDQAVDFAHEVAFVLTAQQFGHLTGYDPYDLEPVDEMGHAAVDEELQASTAQETHFDSADSALDHLIRRAAAERTAPTSRRVLGTRIETSEWRAIESADDEIGRLPAEDLDWDWTAGAEPAAFGDNGAPSAFRPVLHGTKRSEPPIMLLGDRGAADALMQGGQVELEELDAADISELLSLRTDDDVLDRLSWDGARENAPLRVFRVRSGDDGSTS